MHNRFQICHGNRLRTRFILTIAIASVGCKSPSEMPEPKNFEQPANPLMDPVLCQECHPLHHQQWLSSMHAYASADPVFLAMNRRAQRETNGEIGDFCVKCHAPLAVELGATKDGLNLEQLPAWLQGINCYYCHNIAEVTGTHNNPLVLANDHIMRGGIEDPVAANRQLGDTKPVHESSYSPLVDGSDVRASDACGSCHDIVNGHGFHLERTFLEWKNSFYATQASIGCSADGCHMRKDSFPVATSIGTPARFNSFHDHRFPGVDVALHPFPDPATAGQLQAIQLEAISEIRENAMCSSLCVIPGNDTQGPTISVWLHNESAGHSWPSGAGQDRRAWVELKAFAGDQLVYSSGMVHDGEPAVSHLNTDPNFWLMRDRITDHTGKEVHMHWDAVAAESNLLPVNAILTNTSDETTWQERRYLVPHTFDRVEIKVRIRPIGLDILDDLIHTGDLDPIYRDRMQTFEVPGGQLTWPDQETLLLSNTGFGTCVSTNIGCRSPKICSLPDGCPVP